jgi:tetratricopeptide (TPR) repeat protein/transcriptional regulator with XRE-family HTH domain
VLAVAEGAGAKAAARRDRLARRRKALGLTQEDLADRLGIDRSTVVRWERGESEPLPWIRPKLANALQVTADRLEELLAAGVPASPGGAASGAPRQLPAPVAGFTGRSAELDALTRLLDRPADPMATAVVISAIGGTAGVGKTALAIQCAHQVADRFPDGQLYVNLRGYDPGRPMTAGDALAGFLQALGVPGQDIPAEEDERTARYRSLLAAKKVLVVLDNAGSVEQVRPLLPGSASCAVVVTSRDALAGLVARHGATRLYLDLLPPPEAAALLRTLIGQRAADDPGAAETLAAQCCRLPLALRIAAELAASRPDVPLAELAGELADQSRRLDLLEAAGDPRTAVRAVFSWSYHHLDDAARAFRLAGLHPGADFDLYAVAALTGTSLQEARRVTDALARAHLIQHASPGRYGMHDLLRAYARELTNSLDTEGEQQAALTRLFDHYLHTASAAMDTLYPAERHRRPRIPRPATPGPALDDPATAREWLDGERATLVAVTVHATGHGWPSHATRLSATLFRHLDSGGHYPEALAIFSHALSAARRTGDRAAEATARTQIGLIEGRPQQAMEHHRQALVLFRETGDRAGQARTLANMGIAETVLGRYEDAARHQQEAIAISRNVGDRVYEARALGNLGWARQRQGRYQEASRYYQQALRLSREIGDRDGEAWTLDRLGYVNLRLSRHERAAGYFRQALALFRDMGNRRGEAEVLAGLGEVYLGLARNEQAAASFEAALAIFREIGERVSEAHALNGLGDVLFQAGDAGQARAHHAEALRLASQIGDPREQARAHSGLARACRADGDPDQARHHWQQALSLFTELGTPEADQARAQLAATDDDHREREVSRPEKPPSVQ